MGVLDALLDSPRLSESFDEHEHPRDFLGRFKRQLSGLAIGGSAHAPGGITVTRRAEGFHISGGAGLGHYKHSSGEMRTGKHAADETLSNPQSAAMLAVTRSLRSRKPNSFGGATHYQSLDDYEKSKGKPEGNLTFPHAKTDETGRIVGDPGRAVRVPVRKFEPPGRFPLAKTDETGRITGPPGPMIKHGSILMRSGAGDTREYRIESGIVYWRDKGDSWKVHSRPKDALGWAEKQIKSGAFKVKS